MNIDKAREILGEDAGGVSDEDIQRDIETAELLANLCLYAYKNKKLRKTIYI